MTNNYYVLMRREYEYNDEGYDASEGGSPLNVFTDLTEAVKAQKNALRTLEFNFLEGTYVDDWRAFEALFPGVVKWYSTSDSYSYIDSVRKFALDDETLISFFQALHSSLPVYIVELPSGRILSL